MIRRLICAILAVLTLSSCSTFWMLAGGDEPTEINEELSTIDGVTSVQTPANSDGWVLIMTLDEDLDPAGQGRIIDQMYGVLDASDRMGDLNRIELLLGEGRTLLIGRDSRFDNSSGILEYVADLPNFHVNYGATQSSLEVETNLDSFEQVAAEVTRFAGRPLPAGLEMELSLVDPEAPFGQPGDFAVVIGLPISDENQELVDQATTVLADGPAVGARFYLSNDGSLSIRWLTEEQEPELFDQMVELAVDDPRDITMEASYTTTNRVLNSYASQTA